MHVHLVQNVSMIKQMLDPLSTSATGSIVEFSVALSSIMRQ
jgi:hypothetical protein